MSDERDMLFECKGCKRINVFPEHMKDGANCMVYRKNKSNLVKDIKVKIKVDTKEIDKTLEKIKGNQNNGLTCEEDKVMNLLIGAWNEFSKLYSQHPSERKEFAEGINKCQDILGLRVLRKDYPKGWPIKTVGKASINTGGGSELSKHNHSNYSEACGMLNIGSQEPSSNITVNVNSNTDTASIGDIAKQLMKLQMRSNRMGM